MIPTILLPALLIERWWIVPPLTFLWAVLGWPEPVGCTGECALGAVTLAATNAVGAVAFHKGIAQLIKWGRNH